MEQTFSLSTCPSYSTPLSSGFMKSVTLTEENENALVREYNNQKYDAYCSKRSPSVPSHSLQELTIELQKIRSEMVPLLEDTLVVSLQSPQNRNYEFVELVTGQSTTGIGVFSEIKSSFTDFFGAQSGAYNNKISKGEKLCQTQLRMKCLEVGGNAVIAVDID